MKDTCDKLLLFKSMTEYSNNYVIQIVKVCEMILQDSVKLHRVLANNPEFWCVFTEK